MGHILELEITLLESQPKIWRRIQVSSDMNFAALHYAIQFAMGWQNSHLHQFIAGQNERCIGIKYGEDYLDEWEMEDARKVLIGELLQQPEDNIMYEYDFGDGWKHSIEVISVFAPEKGKKYPALIAGVGTCPPEDCGGIGGYLDIVESLQNKDSVNYEDLVEWLGEDFDPADFDLTGTNRRFFKNFKKSMDEWEGYASGD